MAAYSPSHLLRRRRNPARLLPLLEWWITHDILNSHPEDIHLHGGGFRYKDVAVLLVGGHGTGKTSLTLEALHRGHQVYSDEILLVEPKRLLLKPYPRCFVVKGSGMHLFPHLEGLYRTRAPQEVGRSAMVWYVNPGEIRSDYQAASAPCRWLIFPRFQAGAPTQLSTVGELNVVGLLLANAFNFFLNPATLSGIAALARNCRAYELQFGDLTEGADAIEQLLRGSEA